MSLTLMVGSGTQALACASFLVVAYALATRYAKGAEAAIVRVFAAAWVSFALLMAIRATLGVAASLDAASTLMFVAARYVEVVIIAVCGWGVTSYVAFLYTGWRAVTRWTAVYFAIVALLYATLTARGRPSGFTVDEWGAGITPPTPGIEIVYLAVGVPMLASTGFYLSLVARDIRPIQRYRIVLVSSSLLCWVGSGLAASLADASLGSFLAITGLGLVTASAVFLAYNPPGMVLRRWDPDALAATDAERWRRRRIELRLRVRNLV